jgi:hypothetical protein
MANPNLGTFGRSGPVAEVPRSEMTSSLLPPKTPEEIERSPPRFGPTRLSQRLSDLGF